MDFWTAELEVARREVSAIEAKIALEQHNAQLSATPPDAAHAASLVNVLNSTLGHSGQ
jgi:hypothetical protein